MPGCLIFYFRGKDLLCEGARCLIYLCKEKEKAAGSGGFLIPSHPNRKMPPAASLELNSHVLKTPPLCLEDSECPPNRACPTCCRLQGYLSIPSIAEKVNTVFSANSTKQLRKKGREHRRQRETGRALAALGRPRPICSTRHSGKMKTGGHGDGQSQQPKQFLPSHCS